MSSFSRQNSLPWFDSDSSLDRDTILETPPPPPFQLLVEENQQADRRILQVFTAMDTVCDFGDNRSFDEFEEALSSANDPPMASTFEESLLMDGEPLARSPDHGYTSSVGSGASDPLFSNEPIGIEAMLAQSISMQPPAPVVRVVRQPRVRNTFHKPAPMTSQEANRKNGEVYKFVAEQTLKMKPKTTAEEDAESARWTAHGDPNSHSAKYARAYRLEKKNQTSVLQKQVDALTASEAHLKSTVCRKSSTIDDLNKEIVYLRSIIANQSALAPIMQRVLNVSGEKLTANVVEEQVSPVRQSGRKRKPTATVIDAKRQRVGDGIELPANYASADQPGMCIHVRDGRVSIEMCAKCSEQAKRSVQ